MDKLVKYVERSLKERDFCIVLEDELERCWPSEKVDPADREITFKVSPNYVDGSCPCSIAILGRRGHYSSLTAERPDRFS